jgi:hypothetical protein
MDNSLLETIEEPDRTKLVHHSHLNMNNFIYNSFRRGTCTLRLPVMLVILLVQIFRASSQGIPEPNLIFYGRLWNPVGGPFSSITTGTLIWTLQPTSGGSPVVVTNLLSSLYPPFSFIMQVPCESQVGTLTVSSNVLQLASLPRTYNRAGVLLNGQLIYLKYPAQTLFSVTSTNRGQLMQVDLTMLQSDQDSTGIGIPDGWQLQYFGHVGINPNADPDGDGMSNLAEYLAGTDPTNSNSSLSFTSATMASSGGVQVSWSSVVNRSYSLLRSTNLLTGYQVIAAGIPSTPPVTTYQDIPSIPGTTYFYRVSVP